MLVEKVLVAAAEAGLCYLGWKIDWDSHKNSSSSPRCFAFASCSPWVVEGAAVSYTHLDVYKRQEVKSMRNLTKITKRKMIGDTIPFCKHNSSTPSH